MAYARLGDSENARLWLEKAVVAPEPIDWQEQVELRVLQKEAAEVVQAMVPRAQDADSL